MISGTVVSLQYFALDLTVHYTTKSVASMDDPLIWHHPFLGELPVWEPTPIREGERPAIDLGVALPQPTDPAPAR
jgi:hypothetical protein